MKGLHPYRAGAAAAAALLMILVLPAVAFAGARPAAGGDARAGSPHRWATQYMLSDVSFASAKVGWAVGSMGTILKTTDGGKHWKHQGDPYRVEQTGYGSVAAVSKQVCWLAGMGVVLKTTDGGKHWKAAKKPLPTSVGTNSWESVTAVGGSVVWLSSSCGDILRSGNGGKTWSWQRRAALGDDEFGAVVCNGASNAWVPARTYETPDRNNVFRWSGGAWTPYSSPVWYYATGGLADVATSSTTRVWAAGQGGVVYLSDDGGLTWIIASPDPSPLPAWFHTAAMEGVGSTALVVGSGGDGASQSADGMYTTGGVWTRSVFHPKGGLASGINGAFLRTAKIGWAVGGMQVYKTVDGGANWMQIY